MLFTCEVLDENAYEIMQRPAYTDIHGAYPSEEDELMLPMRALTQIGIEEPELNMKIEVKLKLDSGKTIEKTFSVFQGIIRSMWILLWRRRGDFVLRSSWIPWLSTGQRTLFF